MKGSSMHTTHHGDYRDDRGQVLVIVGVALLVLIAMIGLVLDGGSAYAQRRSQQNASDLAALAGANAYLLTNDVVAAQNAALAVTEANGWKHGTDGIVVTVTTDGSSNGARVTVDVDAPHHNAFGSVIGLATSPVGTTATAVSGFPDTAEGAAPMIFNEDVFGPDGIALAQYSNPLAPFAFNGKEGDAPEDPDGFTWTNYGTGNVSTDDVRDIIDGTDVITKTLAFGEYIGQHNQGGHTALFGDVNDHLSGMDLVVPVVDDNGHFQGWSTFHVVSAHGGSQKQIIGYFTEPFQNQQLSIGGDSTTCACFLGNYVLKLID
jgi:Flp pilus assembly protein TadG